MSDDSPPIPAIDPDDRPVTVVRGRGGRRPLLVRLLPLLIVVVALGGFGGIVGYYYFASAGNDGVAPLIKADQQPFKIKPENPGGIEVPDQDKEIYNRVGQAERSSVPPPSAERLLPPPETPLPRPSAPAAGSTPNPNPPNPNPNVGGPVLGAAPTARPSTFSAAPPRPAGAPPPRSASVPPAPDVAPPASVASAKPPATPAPAARPAPPAPAVAPTQTAAATAPARPSGGSVVRVAISSVRSEPDARREWTRQQRLYPQGLAGIVPEFAPVDLGERAVYWRIYVGPAEAGSDAQARCAALKQKQVDCFVARP
ncbi:MAG TPA: SPOR domain-containing protein [Alphaproteobacteria bacterium]